MAPIKGSLCEEVGYAFGMLIVNNMVRRYAGWRWSETDWQTRVQQPIVEVDWYPRSPKICYHHRHHFHEHPRGTGEAEREHSKLKMLVADLEPQVALVSMQNRYGNRHPAAPTPLSSLLVPGK